MGAHYFDPWNTITDLVPATNSCLALAPHEVRAVAIRERFHVFSPSLTVRGLFEQVFHRDPACVRATKRQEVVDLAASVVDSTSKMLVSIEWIDFVEHY